MASNQTTNLKLHKWVAGDRVLREEFNQNSDKIDSAFKALENTMTDRLAAAGNCKIATGSYVGNGSYGSASPKRLTFNFHPLAVAIAQNTTGTNTPGVLFLYSQSQSAGFGSYSSMSAQMNLYAAWSENGISWYSAKDAACQMNPDQQTYFYVAFGQ